MPWNKDHTEYTRPPIPEEAHYKPFPPGVKEGSREAFEQRMHEREAILRNFYRLAVDYTELHKFCKRIACRRAGKCASAMLECHEENFWDLRRYFYDPMRAAMRARKYGGDPPPPVNHEPDRSKRSLWPGGR